MGKEAPPPPPPPKPALILMAVEIPVRTAHAACRRLKSAPAPAEIPVLMMTGFDPRPERAKMVEAGGDNPIVKPIATRDLQVGGRPLPPLKEFRPDLLSTPAILRALGKPGKPTETKAPFVTRGALPPPSPRRR